MQFSTPTFIAVDWSGAMQGVRRKLWLAEARDGRLVRLECGRDREEVVEHLIRLAHPNRTWQDCTQQGRKQRDCTPRDCTPRDSTPGDFTPRDCAQRDLAGCELVIGLDFAFSFPEWFLRWRGVSDARGLWSLAARHGEQWLSECAYPFWGKKDKRKPAAGATPSLFRRTESERLPVRGIAPKTVFQIGGAGAVGTGSLRGMPWLARLQDEGFAIWPFDAPRTPLVFEIYPRYLTGSVAKSNAVARSLYLASRFADQDRALMRIAAAGEDAFDAAVSALSMCAHAESIARLSAETDETYRLEGRIWRPLEDPLFPP